MNSKLVSEFRDPSSEFRGTPFWAWNTRMTPDNIGYTIDALKDMGMGGGYIHVRTGLENAYLSDEFFSLIRHAREQFRENGMHTCLYDEDRWPSGMAGGFVSAERRYRQRFLVFSSVAPEDFPTSGSGHVEGVLFSGDRTLIGIYAIKLSEGKITGCRMIDDPDKAHEGETVRWAWCEVNDNRGLIDTLSADAVDRFIELTHEAYLREVGDGFGKDIPTIFSDEPAFSTMGTLTDPDSSDYITMPWTDRFDEEYSARYGESFLPHLPEIIYLEPSGRISPSAYRYHDLTCELFCLNYMDRIGSWCRGHGLKYTGHVFREDEMDCETYAVGEAMRCYRGFDIPGVDVLSDKRRITTVKQAQSAAHQKGSDRVTCELYGVTGWGFDFRGHKLSGDWQAALGITNRVHHLTWTSMRGNAKRDYPASIGPQAPWYKDYSCIETHFARINTLMTRGKCEVRVGVLHPIETYWLYWGPERQTSSLREDLNSRWKELTNTLLYGLIDFDFISEGLLKDAPDQPAEPEFRVGCAGYDVVVVPDCHTLRHSTYERLMKFAQSGGKLIFLERKPFLLDAAPSDAPQQLPGEVIPYSSYSILTALQPYRTLDVLTPSGIRAGNLFSQLRSENGQRYLFLAHVRPPRNPDIPEKECYTVSVKGTYSVSLMDTLSGKILPVPSRPEHGSTSWKAEGYAYDSWLYVLEPGSGPAAEKAKDRTVRTELKLPAEAEYELLEDNVLVLDTARVKVNALPFSDPLEMRRADPYVRKTIGMEPMRGQPWMHPETEAKDEVTLEYTFEADGEYEFTLACECPERIRAFINGEEITCSVTGFYTDLDIKRLGKGRTQKGTNVLVMTRPYNNRMILENVYLLGGFGVSAWGRRVTMTTLPEKLAFADLTRQKLAFYSGSFRLHLPFRLEKKGSVRVQVSFFRAPCILASADSNEAKLIAFAPYTADLGILDAGEHVLTLTVPGNRENTFGALHLADRLIAWKGPNMWTTNGEAYSDEYQLKEFGLLKAPVLWVEE